MTRSLAVAIIVAATSSSAWAHKPSDAHLQIVVTDERLTGSLAVAVRDLDGALELDFDGNGEVTWIEATTAAPRIAAYAGERLAISAGGAPCPLSFGAATLVDFSDGAYWTLPITGRCASTPETLVVTYKLLFDIDAQHRGIVQVRSAGTTKTMVVRDGNPIAVQLEPSSAWTFFEQGVGRLFGSLRHLVFLGCLVLPVVLRRRDGRWQPVDSWRDVVGATITMFAAFALANLAALLMSAAGLVHLPGPVIEAGVALSIVIVAALNLLRVVDARWDLAFELGLVHGLGFSLWLERLAAPTHRLGPALGFGAGVVLAEAAFVAVLVAALVAARRTVGYQVALWAGSATAAIVGAVWALQRCFA